MYSTFIQPISILLCSYVLTEQAAYNTVAIIFNDSMSIATQLLASTLKTSIKTLRARHEQRDYQQLC
jgi:hypothetical protein